ncbi:MAG TPA: class I SAM-dependent methyltransferase [Pseudonocardiaceae bacterium]|jgi:SAM-dependent methyltransferase|nr:class I SAM-dependent methyltransferase [Pseudonocardiaceae bacterium]
MPAHTHDGIDWVARLADLRQADAANAPALRAVADRLIESLPAPQPTVIDVGCGAGGMSAALAAALAGRAARAAGSPGHASDMPAADHLADPVGDRFADPVGDHLADRAGDHLANPAGDHFADRAGDTQVAAGLPAGGDVGAVAASVGHSTSDIPAAAPDRAADPVGRGAVTGHSAGGAGITVTLGGIDAVAASVGHASELPADHTRDTGGVGSSPGRTGVVADGASGVGPGDGSAAGWPAGGTLVLVDMVPELLAAAVEITMAAAGVSGAVEVRAARADIADPGTFGGLVGADLVWASNVAHHVPDQRAAVATLVGLLAPGGCLALAEGGLSMRCLPWDIGVGEPGLQDRLIAAHGAWFHRMRTEMAGAVRMPVGWNQVLTEAGLSGVTAFSYLVDVPAPLSDAGRAAVVSWLAWMTRATADLLDPADVVALNRLLDPADPAYVGLRDDVFMLKASTVYRGWR